MKHTHTHTHTHIYIYIHTSKTVNILLFVRFYKCKSCDPYVSEYEGKTRGFKCFKNHHQKTPNKIRYCALQITKYVYMQNLFLACRDNVIDSINRE